jgi:hypothetical protein
MIERSPIHYAKIDNQRIGYIEGMEAFDLWGNKRCNYNPSTGNLLELDSGRTIGHVSLKGYFVGSSWVADELFRRPVAVDSPTTSSDQPGTTDSNGSVAPTDMVSTVECISLVISPDEPVTADPTGSVTSPDEAATVEPASVISPDEPVTADPAMLATTLNEMNASGSAVPTEEPTAPGPAASLTTPLGDTPAADYYSVRATSIAEPAAAKQAETRLSIDVERQINEMMRMTLAMKSLEPKSQTVKDVAMRMREHLAGLRRPRPRTGMVKKVDLIQTRSGHERA